MFEAEGSGLEAGGYHLEAGKSWTPRPSQFNHWLPITKRRWFSVTINIIMVSKSLPPPATSSRQSSMSSFIRLLINFTRSRINLTLLAVLTVSVDSKFLNTERRRCRHIRLHCRLVLYKCKALQ